MLRLKEAGSGDTEKEYRYISCLPVNETGFTNRYFGITRKEYEEQVLPDMIRQSKGIDVPEGWVPCTEYFLWDDDRIVGYFRIRQKLNDKLRNGAGHIGYGIGKEFRGRGYATEGLRMTIEKAWQMIPEDEIYMSVSKKNPASLRVQIKNGAYIHHEDEEEYYTRIPRPDGLHAGQKGDSIEFSCI